MGRVLQVSQAHPDSAVVAEAVAVLATGGVVVMPTDSVYGIGCAALPDNPGHDRIFAIKQRDRAQTLPWLVADVDDLVRYGQDVPERALALVRRWWPGALTLVVAASDAVPTEYRAADGTIALRCPDSELVRALARGAGVPLATTSANTHGLAAATSGANVEEHIVEKADLTLDAGPAPVGVASTIVSCADGGITVLREGAIAKEQLVD